MKSLKVLAATLLLVASTSSVAADALGEANKKIVVDFYTAGLMKLDADAAVKFMGPKYIQHNPSALDGIEGFKGFIKYLKEKFPNRTSEIKRVMADGDLVILHVHSKPNPEDRGSAIIDIFRVENGKIVEHWDVIQAVPEKAANTNTMF